MAEKNHPKIQKAPILEWEAAWKSFLFFGVLFLIPNVLHAEQSSKGRDYTDLSSSQTEIQGRSINILDVSTFASDSTLSEADMGSFCGLITTSRFEDAEAYLTSKGIELKDVYKDIKCGSYRTSLLSYVIQAAHVRSFLMLRRYILKNLGNGAYVEFINIKSSFNSTSNECPLEVTKTMLSSNPTDEEMQKIQSLLVQYGAVEDCKF